MQLRHVSLTKRSSSSSSVTFLSAHLRNMLEAQPLQEAGLLQGQDSFLSLAAVVHLVVCSSTLGFVLRPR